MPSAIVCNNISYNYGEITAVKDISFQVKEGEIFGLLGPNGAGKTSLLSILAGIRRPSSGSILLDRLDPSSHSEEIKRIIGYVPQSLAFYSTLTARENLQFFCGIYQIFGHVAKQRIHEVLNVVGLSEKADDIAETYSGGMKRRLNIAIALLHNPKILLLDEPTVGVDPHSRNSIFECIEMLSRAGTTVVYTTHYMEEVERLCKSVAIIDQGRIVALDTPQNLCESIGGAFFQIEIQGDNKHSLVNVLSKMNFISEVNLKQSLLEINAQETQKTLHAILDSSNALDIQISTLSISKPSLETVFLKLTGKGLRDTP